MSFKFFHSICLETPFFFCLFCQLQEQLPTSIHILEQALSVTEDMTLPTGPSLISEPRRKENFEQENTPIEAETSTDDVLQNVVSSSFNENKVEYEAAIKNGSSEGSNGGDIKQIVDTCTEEEEVKVKKNDIVAQVFTMSYFSCMIFDIHLEGYLLLIKFYLCKTLRCYGCSNPNNAHWQLECNINIEFLF